MVAHRDMGTVCARWHHHLARPGQPVRINTGGEKVYPEEVEAALRRSGAVYDVVVVGAPDERWGSESSLSSSRRPGRPRRTT